MQLDRVHGDDSPVDELSHIGLVPCPTWEE